MNDPGLDEAIADAAPDFNQWTRGECAVGKNSTDEEQQREKPQHAECYPVPALYWIENTAFPLIAATLGPMASSFSICSISQPWRKSTSERSPDGLHFVEDPAWELALNAASLSIAIIANLALLMNMARRLSFKVALPIVVMGWYTSSAMLISLLAVFRVTVNPSQRLEVRLTQAYYYAVIAAGLYFFIATLLIVTFYGTWKGHYDAGFHLTTSQRTLMLQTMTFFIYLLGGSAVFAKIEGWSFLEAVYWADSTLLTIGLGNIVPKTHTGRSLLFPYAVGGIMILGLIVGSIRSLMLEKGKQKIADRVTEKTRKFLIKKAALQHSAFHAIIPPLNLDPAYSTEEKRRNEFVVMRRVRQMATYERQWISLLLSLLMWMMMWFIGAVAFWRAEKAQDWTYFESLYFAYTTLLTIGYGDFYPTSNWGIPFYVFWTLLAVPSLTILISNIADTLVRGIRDFTIFIGELTILPGEQPIREHVKDLFRYSWIDRILSETITPDPESQERGDREKRMSDISPEETAQCALSDRENEIEADEHRKERAAREHGDIRAESVHHYHYLLFREMQKMIKYITHEPRKEFSYEEWEYYLKLIGADEASSNVSSGPLPDIDIERNEAENGLSMSEQSRKNQTETATDRWSWISKRNPIVCNKSEPQWLLEALIEVLETGLRKASRDYHTLADQDRDDQPSAANEEVSIQDDGPASLVSNTR